MTTASLGDQPSRLPTADLAGMFASSDRSAALSGLLPPPPSVRPFAGKGRSATEGTTQGTQHSAETPRATGGSSPLVVIVYLPASLRTRLREASARTGATYTDLTLDAIDSTHTHLTDLLANPARPNHSPSLFTNRPAHRRRRHSEPQVQVSLRLTISQLQVIDNLVSDCGAPNRSALVSAALEAQLVRE